MCSSVGCVCLTSCWTLWDPVPCPGKLHWPSWFFTLPSIQACWGSPPILVLGWVFWFTLANEVVWTHIEAQQALEYLCFLFCSSAIVLWKCLGSWKSRSLPEIRTTAWLTCGRLQTHKWTPGQLINSLEIKKVKIKMVVLFEKPLSFGVVWHPAKASNYTCQRSLTVSAKRRRAIQRPPLRLLEVIAIKLRDVTMSLSVGRTQAY